MCSWRPRGAHMGGQTWNLSHKAKFITQTLENHSINNIQGRAPLGLKWGLSGLENDHFTCWWNKIIQKMEIHDKTTNPNYHLCKTYVHTKKWKNTRSAK